MNESNCLEFTGERYIPGTLGNIELEHLHRYLLAQSICKGTEVLDIASGEGYGWAILAEQAKHVIGVYISTEAVAALALLAVHPLGLAWWRRRRGWPGTAMMVVCGLVAAWMIVRIPLGRAANIDYRGSKNAAHAGDYIRKRTTPEDRVLVWGWAAWATHYHAQRFSPSAIFKVLGQVTEYNQNGMFTRSQSTDFQPGPHADRLLADFERTPPAYVVKTAKFFPGALEDPLAQFSALNAIFRRDYVLDRKFGRLEIYERKDRRTGRDDADAAREDGRGSRGVTGAAGRAGEAAHDEADDD